MRASRRSHSTESYGFSPGLVKYRLIPIPTCSGAIAIGVRPFPRQSRPPLVGRSPASNVDAPSGPPCPLRLAGAAGVRCLARPAVGVLLTTTPASDVVFPNIPARPQDVVVTVQTTAIWGVNYNTGVPRVSTPERRRSHKVG